MNHDLSSFLPLSPAVLHIFLALAREDRHGYAIMQEIARQSEGKYKMGPGTLYDNLQKLLERGFLAEQPGKKDSEEDPRRRYYQLTPPGRQLLSTEIDRLESVVREARLHLQTSQAGSR